MTYTPNLDSRQYVMKQEKWVCASCGEVTAICSHLEALLPSVDEGSPPRRIPSESAARSSMSFFQTMFPPHDPVTFLELIRNYGIVDQWELDLLEAYFVRNLSSEEIAEEFGWVGSGRTVRRRIKAIKEELVRRGIKQELE